MYLILIILGVLIGAEFLIDLLIGDRREAAAKERQRMIREAVEAAKEHQEGSWPPPVGRIVEAPEAETVPPPDIGVHYQRARYWYYVMWLSVRALLVLAVLGSWISMKFGMPALIVVAILAVAAVVWLAVRRAKGR